MRLSNKSSHLRLKSINQQKVLQLIYTNESISRVELAQKTQLSQQTITNIVNRLLEDKLVLEGDHSSHQSGSGRKRVPLSINYSQLLAVGIELAGKYIRGSVFNFHKECLHTSIRSTDKYESPQHLIQLVHELLEELIYNDNMKSNLIRGIGISVQGLVDSVQGIILRMPGIGFRNIHLKEELEGIYRLPVHLENDVNLIAVTEHLMGSWKHSSNNMTLKFDYGIGGAIIANGELVSGSSYVAGEFGHYKGFSPPYSYPCFCGSHGCLTTLMSVSGLKTTLGYTFEDFVQKLDSGDETATQLVQIWLEAASRAIGNLVTFLNPDRILLTGCILAAMDESWLDNLQKRVLDNTPVTSRKVEFHHMKEIPDETLLAANLVIKKVFEIPIEALSL